LSYSFKPVLKAKSKASWFMYWKTLPSCGEELTWEEEGEGKTT
jgi:hypothetical protein